MKDHKCDEKCEIATKHICSSDCMGEDGNKECELASHKKVCSDAAEKHGHGMMKSEEKIFKVSSY